MIKKYDDESIQAYTYSPCLKSIVIGAKYSSA